MRVRMLKTRPAAPDGVHVQLYRVGEVYTLSDFLGGIFLTEGWAERFTSDEALDALQQQRFARALPGALSGGDDTSGGYLMEQKDAGAAPENKAMPPAEKRVRIGIRKPKTAAKRKGGR